MKPGLFHRRTHLMYLLGFFSTLHYTLPLYINSEFLGALIGNNAVGFIYSLSNALMLAALFLIPTIIRRFRPARASFFLLLLQLPLLLTLAWLGLPWLVLFSFISYSLFARLIYVLGDVLLEQYSTDTDTGGIRGTYLTIASTATLISPLLSGLLVDTTGSYVVVYLAAALAALAALGILLPQLASLHEESLRSVQSNEHIWSGLSFALKDRDLRSIFFVTFLLNAFFAWMVIYTPIYLISTVGFEWDVLGPIFSVMLLPFVLFEFPLGKLADRKYGEQELMIGGFFVLVLATISLVLPTTPNPWLWAPILFSTRVGAAAIEIMSETYFFKKIDSSRSSLISAYRMMAPLAYITIPLAASLLLTFTNLTIRSGYLVVALLLTSGLWAASRFKDTN